MSNVCCRDEPAPAPFMPWPPGPGALVGDVESTPIGPDGPPALLLATGVVEAVGVSELLGVPIGLERMV